MLKSQPADLSLHNQGRLMNQGNRMTRGLRLSLRLRMRISRLMDPATAQVHMAQVLTSLKKALVGEVHLSH